MTQTEKHRVDNLEKKRHQLANNLEALSNEIGAIPDPRAMSDLRIEAIVRRLYGEMDLDETGSFVGGSTERLEFEVEYLEFVYQYMQAKREAFLAARARGGLVLPGG